MKIATGTALVLVLISGCRSQSQSSSPDKPSPAPAESPAAAPAAATTAPPPPPGVPGAPPPVAAKPVATQLPEVIATVDDDKIERWELEGAIKSVEARAGSPIPAERRDEILRGLIDQLVAYHVLAREAKDQKVASSDAEFSSRMAQIKSGFPNEQAFQDALKAQGITLNQLQRQTRMGVDIDKLIQVQVVPTISVQDADVAAFYQQNLAQFAQTESVHASHILIATPQGTPPADKQAAKAKAQELLSQLKGGSDFAKLAQAQSQDPGSAKAGGDLGFFPKGQTDPAFEAAAFGLKDGELSDVVETNFGYHLIKVHEHRAARTAPLEEVSARIKEFLAGQQREAKIQALVEQAKSKRKVQILV